MKKSDLSQAIDNRLQELLNEYKKMECTVRNDPWIVYCKGQPSLKAAITAAAESLNYEGKRHPHQRRIKIGALLRFRDILLDKIDEIQAAESFEDLRQILYRCKAERNIKYIGPLAVFDVSLRVVSYMSEHGYTKILPNHIYLHAGAQKGLENLLERKVYGPFIERGQLHLRLANSDLTCLEIEDFLCVFKDYFNNEHNIRDHKNGCTGFQNTCHS